MARKTKRKSRSSSGRKANKSLAIVALIINILFPLGIGSMIGGKVKAGIWQALLFVVGAVIWYADFGAGLILCTVSWIWGVVSGIQMIQEAN